MNILVLKKHATKDEKIYINFDKVCYFECGHAENYTCIELDNGRIRSVSETPDEILEMLRLSRIRTRFMDKRVVKLTDLMGSETE